MNCPQCGQPNLPGSAFCDSCGFDLNQVPVSPPAAPVYPPAPTSFPAAAPPPQAAAGACPQCGTVAPVGAAFCDNCGGALGAAAPSPVSPAWLHQPAPMAPAPYQTPPTAPAPYQTPPTAPAPYQTPPTAPAPYQAPAIGGSCPSCGQPVVPGAAFCDSCGANLPAPGGYPPIAPPVTPPVMPPVMSGMRMLLVVANSGVQMPLAGKQEFYLGREDPIGQFFPDADLTPHGGDVGGVSRRHAKIVVYGNQVMFEDLNSTNGSFVNKVKVQPGQPVPLTNGAEVRLGKVVLLFQTS